MKFKSNEEGKCPICNSENLEYFGMEFDTMGNIYYPWHCPDCDTDGKEWYYVNFNEVTAYTPDGDMSGYEEGICPECGGEIDYGTVEPNGNSLGYGIDENQVIDATRFGVLLNGGCGIEWQIAPFLRWSLEQHLSLGLPSMSTWMCKTGLAFCF